MWLSGSGGGGAASPSSPWKIVSLKSLHVFRIEQQVVFQIMTSAVGSEYRF